MTQMYVKGFLIVLFVPLLSFGQNNSKNTNTSGSSESNQNSQYLAFSKKCEMCDQSFRIPKSLSGIYTWSFMIGEVRSLTYYESRMCRTKTHEDCWYAFLSDPGVFWFCSESCLNGYKSNR
jgi:hypothetical protein